jgi:hypothetical protein
MNHPKARIEAAARALAADLQHTVPTKLDGEDGCRAVAERALSAADVTRRPSP